MVSTTKLKLMMSIDLYFSTCEGFAIALQSKGIKLQNYTDRMIPLKNNTDENTNDVKYDDGHFALCFS